MRAFLIKFLDRTQVITFNTTSLFVYFIKIEYPEEFNVLVLIIMIVKEFRLFRNKTLLYPVQKSILSM